MSQIEYDKMRNETRKKNDYRINVFCKFKTNLLSRTNFVIT